MKKLQLLLSLLILLGAPTLSAKAVLRGKIYNHKDSIDFARVKVISPGFTAMKNYEWYTDIDEEGTFEFEMNLPYATELYFSFKHQYFPVLLYPDSELIIKFDAKAFLEAASPQTVVVQEGSAAQVNKWMLDFLDQYEAKFPSWEEKRRWEEMNVKNYQEFKKSEIEAKLNFAESYRVRRMTNDAIFEEWMEQHIKLLAVRNYLSFNFAYNKRTGAGPYAMLGPEYYNFWSDYAKEFPRKVISFAYKRFVATYVNYDMLFIQQQSSDQKKASKKEQLNDMVAKLNEDLKGHSRDAALGILLGVHLDLPDLKRLIDEDLVREIEDENIYFQLLEKYKTANGIRPDFKNPEWIIEVGEQERDVLSLIRERFSEKVVLIDVWATWCGGCIRTMKDKFPSFIEKFSPEEVAFVFICVGSVENTWAQKVNELALDGYQMIVSEDQFRKTQTGFNIQGLPRYLLMNQKGRIVQADAPGPGPELINEIQALLDQ